MDTNAQRKQLTIAGILLGLGLGGFFDGIVLHQILQWHHMLTSTGSYPANTVAGLEVNTLWDGLFHASTYIFVVAGLLILWNAALKGPLPWSTRAFIGTMLMGWGIFNLVEGIIDHQLLGIHHVNETVPQSQWIYWDIGFLVWGATMLVGGWLLTKGGGHLRQRHCVNVILTGDETLRNPCSSDLDKLFSFTDPDVTGPACPAPGKRDRSRLSTA